MQSKKLTFSNIGVPVGSRAAMIETEQRANAWGISCEHDSKKSSGAQSKTTASGFFSAFLGDF